MIVLALRKHFLQRITQSGCRLKISSQCLKVFYGLEKYHRFEVYLTNEEAISKSTEVMLLQKLK